jgi:NADH:ubiquinone oxidoreductase subunit 6 (subunit J)
MPYGLLGTEPSAPAAWWPMALPLLAGGAGVYLLLPRPRAHPARWGAGLGLLALVLAGVLLTRSGGVSPETVLFWGFSAIGIIAGGLLVTQHNPARAALSFTLVVLSTCGLFLLLAAPFLMAATIIIYAGAIIVTFLFVIMLAQQVGLSDADDRSREPLLSTLTGFVLLGTLLFVLQRYDDRIRADRQEIGELIDRTQHVAKQDSKAAMAEGVGRAGTEDDLFLQYKRLYRDKHNWKDLDEQVGRVMDAWADINPRDPDIQKPSELLQQLATIGQDAQQRLGWLPLAGSAPLSNLSGPTPTVESEHVRRDKDGLPRMPAENAAYVGRALFTDFLLPVELGGSLLLVATVGAIAIAFRRS